VNKIK